MVEQYRSDDLHTAIEYPVVLSNILLGVTRDGFKLARENLW